MVEELSQFKTVCLCITSRITTIPSDCETLDIPTLSMEAARDTFHRISKNVERSDLVGNILERLDFHPLSITLLATVAHHNKWNVDRLTREWEMRRTGLLRTQHNKSFAATIELSLASPTFQELGPDARGLLSVIAFFPQGIDENNLCWLFPTISDGRDVFDKFGVLSLTYRSDGFITMLAPLRDYLRPEDPTSSPLLRATKERYFERLSVFVNPGSPDYEKARWITSEDVNVEHLLDIFTSIDANSDNIWDTCANFMGHHYWHKPRLVVLGPKLERLPDNQPSKPRCLYQLSRLFALVGNHGKCKPLLAHTLRIWRERGDDFQVAKTLRLLSSTNERLGLHKEGILQAKEALGLFERLDDVLGQVHSLQELARLLYADKQLDAAEEAASRSIKLLPDNKQFEVGKCHRILGDVCRSKGEIEKAIIHFEAALQIASSFNWHHEQFSVLYSLAVLFRGQGRFDDAYAHVERSKPHAINDAYIMGYAMELQAQICYQQGRLGEAKSEALSAADVFEKHGATRKLERCRELLRDIEERMKRPITSDEPDHDGEPLGTAPPSTPISPPSSARGTE